MFYREYFKYIFFLENLNLFEIIEDVETDNAQEVLDKYQIYYQNDNRYVLINESISR